MHEVARNQINVPIHSFFTAQLNQVEDAFLIFEGLCNELSKYFAYFLLKRVKYKIRNQKEELLQAVKEEVSVLLLKGKSFFKDQLKRLGLKFVCSLVERNPYRQLKYRVSCSYSSLTASTLLFYGVNRHYCFNFLRIFEYPKQSVN